MNLRVSLLFESKNSSVDIFICASILVELEFFLGDINFFLREVNIDLGILNEVLDFTVIEAGSDLSSNDVVIDGIRSEFSTGDHRYKIFDRHSIFGEVELGGLNFFQSEDEVSEGKVLFFGFLLFVFLVFGKFFC